MEGLGHDFLRVSVVLAFGGGLSRVSGFCPYGFTPGFGHPFREARNPWRCKAKTLKGIGCGLQVPCAGSIQWFPYMGGPEERPQHILLWGPQEGAPNFGKPPKS